MNSLPDIIPDTIADDEIARFISECSNIDELKQFIEKTYKALREKLRAETTTAYHRRYYQNHKDKIIEYSKKRYQNLEQREAIIAKQKEYEATERGKQVRREINRRSREKRKQQLMEERRKQELMSQSTNSGSGSSSSSVVGHGSDNENSN